MAGGHTWQGWHVWGGCVTGKMALAAGDTHPTGIQSCFFYFEKKKQLLNLSPKERKWHLGH